jgi:hypothetical protein
MPYCIGRSIDLDCRTWQRRINRYIVGEHRIRQPVLRPYSMHSAYLHRQKGRCAILQRTRRRVPMFANYNECFASVARRPSEIWIG